MILIIWIDNHVNLHENFYKDHLMMMIRSKLYLLKNFYSLLLTLLFHLNIYQYYSLLLLSWLIYSWIYLITVKIFIDDKKKTIDVHRKYVCMCVWHSSIVPNNNRTIYLQEEEKKRRRRKKKNIRISKIRKKRRVFKSRLRQIMI